MEGQRIARELVVQHPDLAERILGPKGLADVVGTGRERRGRSCPHPIAEPPGSTPAKLIRAWGPRSVGPRGVTLVLMLLQGDAEG